jgi:hypothetical protein
VDDEAIGVMVTVDVAVTLAFLVEVAVMVTEPEAEGAVKTVVAPLAVWVGLKVPHEPAGAQLQSTPSPLS